MTPARQITLDAQFGRDLERLRWEFSPSRQGTRDDVFVPVRVVAPMGKRPEVTLLVYARNLYVLGWESAQGTAFHLADSPYARQDGVATLAFGSSYFELGARQLAERISRHAVWGAVATLSKAAGLSDANAARQEVALMALVVSEALRNRTLAGVVGRMLAYHGRSAEMRRDLALHHAQNYRKFHEAGYPEIALPPEG